MRSGILAKKVGMSSLYVGRARVPVTLFHLGGARVVGERSDDKGRFFLQIGVGERRRPSKSLEGVYSKRGLSSVPMLVREFRVDSDSRLPVGGVFSSHHFAFNQKVDVSGITIGRGFAGGMKRWNFSGLRASHGVSISHRSSGSTGQRQDPGRVFKGKKMPGHMGCRRVTVQNLSVVYLDEEGLVFGVKGCVPGFDGCFVEVRDALKSGAFDGIPTPGVLKEGNVSEVAK